MFLHISKEHIAFRYRGSSEIAIEEIRNPEVCVWYAYRFTVLGRFEEAGQLIHTGAFPLDECQALYWDFQGIVLS